MNAKQYYFETHLPGAGTARGGMAIDVFPEEPLPASHRARRTRNLILCAHQAGALDAAIKHIGKLAVGDAELIARGLPPVLCKVAQPETVKLLRSKPIDKS